MFHNIIKSYINQEKLCKQLGIWEIVSKSNPEHSKNLLEDDHEFLRKKNEIISVLNYPEFDNYLSPEKVEYVSRIGTRLQSLSDREINLLMQHGSTLAGVQIRTYFGELLKS